MKAGNTIDGGSLVGGHYWGTFTFRENWNTVTEINQSTRQLIFDDITVINLTSKPTVTLAAPGTPVNFDIEQIVFPTLVTLTPQSSSQLLFNATIDNPLGDTEIVNTGGDIAAGTARGGGSPAPAHAPKPRLPPGPAG